MEIANRSLRAAKGFTTLEAAVMLLLLTIFSMVSIAVFKKGLPDQQVLHDDWKAKGGDAAVINARTLSPAEQQELSRMPLPPQSGPKTLTPTPGLDGEPVR